jgi:hypothetical protein
MKRLFIFSRLTSDRMLKAILTGHGSNTYGVSFNQRKGTLAFFST